MEDVKYLKPEELEIDKVYETYVKDLVSVKKVDHEKESVTLYNITGSFSQMTLFRDLRITRKIR